MSWKSETMLELVDIKKLESSWSSWSLSDSSSTPFRWQRPKLTKAHLWWGGCQKHWKLRLQDTKISQTISSKTSRRWSTKVNGVTGKECSHQAIKAYMIPLNVFKVGHSTMTVVAGRSVRRAKTITLRPMAVIAIPILMELKQIPLPVSLLTRFKNPSGLFAAHK